jgi:hypothetical protein
MTTLAIRKKLVNYLEVADGKKVKAMYALLENEIENSQLEYSDKLKKSLDETYVHYKNGGKMISAKESKKRIDAILHSFK